MKNKHIKMTVHVPEINVKKGDTGIIISTSDTRPSIWVFFGHNKDHAGARPRVINDKPTYIVYPGEYVEHDPCIFPKGGDAIE